MLLAFHQVWVVSSTDCLDGEEDESDTVGMRSGRVDCGLIWASCGKLEVWSVSGRVSHVEYPSQLGCFSSSSCLSSPSSFSFP